MVIFYILKCASRYNVYVKEVNGTFCLLRSCLTIEVSQKAYSLVSVKGKKVSRGDSSLNVVGYEVYKYDKKYIFVQVEENKKFEEFSIKLLLYHCL